MSEVSHPLAYPGTNVMQNRLGLRDAQKLRQFEYAAANARLRQLIAHPIRGNFDLDHLKAIHKHLLGDTYDWAGQTRDEVFARNEVIYTKGRDVFALHSELKPDATKLFAGLAKENRLQGLEGDKEGFVERLSHYYTALNKIHPFPEGNGRATQLFLSQLSEEAGYKLDFSKVDKTKWNLAARESHAGRTGMVKDIFDSIASPQRAIAFDKLDPESALKKHPELHDAFVVLANARRMAQLRFKAPDDQARFINLYRTKISDELHQGNKIAGPTRDRPDRGPTHSR